MMFKLLILFTVLLHVLSDNFDDFKLKMEGKVAELAEEMRQSFNQRCNGQVSSCETKSFNECQGTDSKKCFEDFPKPEICLSNGAFLSESSAIRFPNDVSTSSLTAEEKQFVCTSALLQDKFQQLDSDRNGEYGKAYIGTNLGSLRVYPAGRQLDEEGKCVNYDPRFRPWYVTATSGAKNIILLIDISGSMDGSKIDSAKEAAISVVNTLSNSDFVGVVSFATNAKTLHSSKILRATSETKEKITEKIEGLEAVGSTNYEEAFRKGLSMLKAATKDEFGAPCVNGQNIILFLTDGTPTIGESTSAGLKDVINQYGINITLFTYGFGNSLNETILQDLSCEYSGIFFSIPNSSSKSQLATTMRSYYTFIAEGVDINQPVWTEPYDDFFGFGRMVTVSMPIYYEENNIKTILGVAGIDVVMSQFQKYNLNEDDVIKRLLNNAHCHKSSLGECELEALRNKKCSSNCLIEQNSLQVCFSGINVFKTHIDDSDYICCGLTIAAFVGIIVSIIVVLIIVIVVIVCIKKKSPPSEPSEQNDNNPESNRQFQNPYQQNQMVPPGYFQPPPPQLQPPYNLQNPDYYPPPQQQMHY